ncbi:MAG: glycosyltransferase family 39 protein [Desulfamplus sp.]|nr:glycosyltransferase family 39 protein [Desulfamplus sp.]
MEPNPIPPEPHTPLEDTPMTHHDISPGPGTSSLLDQPHGSPWRAADILLTVLISGVALVISLLASVPPVDRDALTHHLYVPRLYLQNGGIYEIPHLSFSYYPMNLDLLYMIPLYLGNDIIPKFIHFAFALATAAMIFHYINRRMGRTLALLGALFFLTMPVIVRLSSTVYVDLGLICFMFASIMYIFRWIESGFKARYLVVSGIFCGLALGTKYNGLIGLFLLGLFVPFIHSRYHAGEKRHAIRALCFGIIFVSAALMAFSPWMIRNTLWTGNPIYPLYNSVFNPKQNPVPEPLAAPLESSTPLDNPDSSEMPGSLEQTASSETPTHSQTVVSTYTGMSNIETRRHIYNESWLEIALIPLRVFFQGQDDDPKYFDGRLHPFLLLLPMFAFMGSAFSRRQEEKREKLILLFFSLLFLLYACVNTGIRIRYFSPIIPPLVVLSMFGLHNLGIMLRERLPGVSINIKNFIVGMVILFMLGMNGWYIADRFKRDQPMAYITGKVTRDEYIQAYRPEYASFQYANQNLSKDSKIFGLYLGNRGYYSDREIRFSIEKLQNAAEAAVSGRDVAESLRAEGFTHLMVNYSLFNYWVSKYPLHDRVVLNDFFENHAAKEFSRDGYGLMRLLQ